MASTALLQANFQNLSPKIHNCCSWFPRKMQRSKDTVRPFKGAWIHLSLCYTAFWNSILLYPRLSADLIHIQCGQKARAQKDITMTMFWFLVLFFLFWMPFRNYCQRQVSLQCHRHFSLISAFLQGRLFRCNLTTSKTFFLWEQKTIAKKMPKI